MSNNKKQHKMKKTKLTIGTKVSYNKVSLTNGETTSLESVVKGFYRDGSLHYVCLENGDKMFKEALTVTQDNSKRIKQLEDRLFRLRANGRHLQNSITINATEELLKTLR